MRPLDSHDVCADIRGRFKERQLQGTIDRSHCDVAMPCIRPSKRAVGCLSIGCGGAKEDKRESVGEICQIFDNAAQNG